VVDSSDEEEANKAAATATALHEPDKMYYKCSQLSDNCILFMYNPNKQRKEKKTKWDPMKERWKSSMIEPQQKH
jgi:hypothetical protein